MTAEQLEDFLGGSDHKGTALLAISRTDRGPMVVPLSFRWSDGTFRFSTKRSRRHAKEFARTGRATVMVHHERYGAGVQVERYVAAEGPIAIVPDAPQGEETFVEAVLAPDSIVAVIYDFSEG